MTLYMGANVAMLIVLTSLVGMIAAAVVPILLFAVGIVYFLGFAARHFFDESPHFPEALPVEPHVVPLNTSPAGGDERKAS